jgi:hypothetical protein
VDQCFGPAANPDCRHCRIDQTKDVSGNLQDQDNFAHEFGIIASTSWLFVFHTDSLLALNTEASVKFGLRFLALPLVVLTAGCSTSSPRMLQSVTASPATADAKNFPNGRVQFVPTGIYNKPPLTVTPQPVTAWSTNPNTIAVIDQNGIAECQNGQVGTAKIQVAVAGDGPMMDVAQLTCP